MQYHELFRVVSRKPCYTLLPFKYSSVLCDKDSTVKYKGNILWDKDGIVRAKTDVFCYKNTVAHIVKDKTYFGIWPLVFTRIG